MAFTTNTKTEIFDVKNENDDIGWPNFKSDIKLYNWYIIFDLLLEVKSGVNTVLYLSYK